MRRYRVRNDDQAALVGPAGSDRFDPWHLFARPDRPRLRLELGCGHGEFITAMAEAHPDDLFLGVEHDPLRVTKTAHKCVKAGIGNVRMFGGDAHSFVRFRLPDACLDRIYILFPDPWPKADHRRRRLVTRAFLHDLARIAAPGCRLMFASDTHNYAMQVLANTTTLPGLWRSRYQPSGYRIDIPTRFPTLFERYKKSEGCTIAYVHLERSDIPAGEPLPWPSTDRSPSP